MDIIIISFLFLLSCLFGENGDAQYFMLSTALHFWGGTFYLAQNESHGTAWRSIRHEYCVTIFCWSKKIR